MDTLTSCTRKIGRAEVHLLPLLEQVGNFMRGRPYAVATYTHAEPNRHSFRALQFDPFDDVALGLLAGDFVHNLRCALDHLVWGLALKNRGETVVRKNRQSVYFPIVDNYEGFITHPVMKFLTLDEIAAVERHQPFARGHDKRLLDLNSIWNADKHQIIQPVLIGLPQSGIGIALNDDAGTIVKRGLKEKVTLKHQTPGEGNPWTDLGWVEVSAPGPKPEVNVNSLTVEIAVGERRVEVERFPELRDLVSEIVKECSKFL